MGKYILMPSMRTPGGAPTNQVVVANGLESNDTGLYILCGLSTSLEISNPFYFAYVNNQPTYLLINYRYGGIYGASEDSDPTARAQSYGGLDNSYAYGQESIYYASSTSFPVPKGFSIADSYGTLNEALSDILSEEYIKISYVTGVCSIAAPKLVKSGTIVNGYVTIPLGITVTESDISVKKGDTSLPFTYNNGVLTFTAE